MRFHPDEYFEMDVFPIPKGVELYDGCVYYIDYGDGQPLVESYNRFSSDKYDMYQPEDTWEETLKYYNQLYKKQIGNAPNWKEKFNRLFN